MDKRLESQVVEIIEISVGAWQEGEGVNKMPASLPAYRTHRMES